MKTSRNLLLAALLCGSSIHALAAAAATASVSDCWIRALPGDLPSGGYFKASNSGDQPVNLVGVGSDAFGMAMLHQTQSQGSMSSMAMVDQVAVPAHGSLVFAPGNYHVMLEHPKQPLQIGTTIPLTFSFSDGEKVTAACAVKSAGTMSQ
ncbi:copper chaperone PCu(A)C [Paraburkholderia sp. 1N]|uniref:Copper chaperone PCu(A)C n=1 Tax=Paraburkholderia solitsugae TaxID=2675748 RepID=A0ABX2BI78_9BURK|nr:copper chaperone PCu(A)C [Paraburkholderia solitsugae]NPT40627.1 copper chaperone PCu(A)C [Paraburkholderia solitsugae]